MTEATALAIQLLHATLCALGQHEWATAIPFSCRESPSSGPPGIISVPETMRKCKYCGIPQLDRSYEKPNKEA